MDLALYENYEVNSLDSVGFCEDPMNPLTTYNDAAVYYSLVLNKKTTDKITKDNGWCLQSLYEELLSEYPGLGISGSFLHKLVKDGNLSEEKIIQAIKDSLNWMIASSLILSVKVSCSLINNEYQIVIETTDTNNYINNYKYSLTL